MLQGPPMTRSCWSTPSSSAGRPCPRRMPSNGQTTCWSRRRACRSWVLRGHHCVPTDWSCERNKFGAMVKPMGSVGDERRRQVGRDALHCPVPRLVWADVHEGQGAECQRNAGRRGVGSPGRAGSAVRAALRVDKGATLNWARVGAAGGARTAFIGDTKQGFCSCAL